MMMLNNQRRLIIRNQEILTDLSASGWITLDVENPKRRTESPGVIMGYFVHPLTGATADPDPANQWAVFVSEGAIRKRSSDFLAETEPWSQLREEATGRWLVFAHEEPVPDIPHDFDWENGSLLPFLPKMKTEVVFEQSRDAVLFHMMMS